MEENDVKHLLQGVVYNMYYLRRQVDSLDLFPENFCAIFKKTYPEHLRVKIEAALKWAEDQPDYAYEKIDEDLGKKYSREEIKTYTSRFYERLKTCI